MTRRHDTRRARNHLTYTVLDIMRTFNVGASTVSAWIKAGLPRIDDRKPFLFAGIEIARFLDRRNKPRQPSSPGEMYCVACKRTIRPVGDQAILIPLNAQTGELICTCPFCGRKPHRRVRLSELRLAVGELKLLYEDGTIALAHVSAPPHTGSSEGGAA